MSAFLQPPGRFSRMNQNYEVGADALRAYAEGWPAAGYEFRKQYIIFQTIDNPGEST